MANLDIHVGTKTTPAQTTSLYRVTKNDHVTFYNEGTATLTVTFLPQGSTSPLCDNQEVPTSNPLTVLAGGNSGSNLKVCKVFNANQFAYSAQIEGFAAEDPIVIIERTMGSPTLDITSALIGAGIGLLAGFVLAKLLKGGKTRMPA